MRTEFERNVVVKLRSEGKGFKEIFNIMNISINSAGNVFYYQRKHIKNKYGPKPKITNFDKLQIKRQIAHYKNVAEQINTSKIKNSCCLKISTRSIQWHLKCEGLKYVKSKSKIVLSKKHKEVKLEIIRSWITSCHKLERTVFSEEKRFSFDGPDDWRTYVSCHEHVVRCKRQCLGSGVMVLMTVLPNFLLSFTIIEEKF